MVPHVKLNATQLWSRVVLAFTIRLILHVVLNYKYIKLQRSLFEYNVPNVRQFSVPFFFYKCKSQHKDEQSAKCNSFLWPSPTHLLCLFFIRVKWCKFPHPSFHLVDRVMCSQPPSVRLSVHRVQGGGAGG